MPTRPRSTLWRVVVPGVAALGIVTTALSACTARPAEPQAATASTGTATSPVTTPGAGPSQGATAEPTPPVGLPTPGTPVPAHGSGRTTPVAVDGADSGAKGRTVRYSVEVEGGLEHLAVGFPEAVHDTLVDPRGWETRDHVHFVHVTPEEQKAGRPVDIRILFASPDLVDRKCAPLRTNGRLSCHSDGEVVINAWRWVNGADTFKGDMGTYRLYVVNHEVGHSIGHSHAACPGPGRPAPVMLQQTLRLDGCTIQPWPTGTRS